MRSELVIRRIASGRFDVSDTVDPTFELTDINDAQLLGYLRNRKLVGTTADDVLSEFESDEKRAVVYVVIDRSL